jgi:hypothetical protein
MLLFIVYVLVSKIHATHALFLKLALVPTRDISNIPLRLPHFTKMKVILVKCVHFGKLCGKKKYRKYLRASEGTLVSAAFAVVSTNPHWDRVVGYGPFYLCIIHNKGLCPSSGDINRLMMMMKNSTDVTLSNFAPPKSCVLIIL